MRIATFNVNGVNGRLAVLLQWLAEEEPDVVCLQELKAPQSRFPAAAIERAGYGAVWQGQCRWNGVAILARDAEPILTRRNLPGDPEDEQARYIEAVVRGVLIGCLYAPNGNPAPGPKFDYKLRWLERLADHAADLLATGAPVILAGDYNVIPTDRDVYAPERWRDDALFRPEQAFARLLAARRRVAPRSFAAEPRHGRPACRCRCRPGGARRRARERSCASLDRDRGLTRPGVPASPGRSGSRAE
jgi:exodeoxyribonuclease III